MSLIVLLESDRHKGLSKSFAPPSWVAETVVSSRTPVTKDLRLEGMGGVIKDGNQLPSSRLRTLATSSTSCKEGDRARLPHQSVGVDGVA